MKKFGNTANKARAILDVFRHGERLNGKAIAKRLMKRGYNVNIGNLRMFIYYYMLHKHLGKESVEGTNYYFRV